MVRADVALANVSRRYYLSTVTEHVHNEMAATSCSLSCRSGRKKVALVSILGACKAPTQMTWVTPSTYYNEVHKRRLCCTLLKAGGVEIRIRRLPGLPRISRTRIGSVGKVGILVKAKTVQARSRSTQPFHYLRDTVL